MWAMTQKFLMTAWSVWAGAGLVCDTCVRSGLLAATRRDVP